MKNMILIVLKYKCLPKNKKSRAIPTRLGFTQEGILRSDECLQGEFSDSYVYSLLRKEYESQI